MTDGWEAGCDHHCGCVFVLLERAERAEALVERQRNVCTCDHSHVSWSTIKALRAERALADELAEALRETAAGFGLDLASYALEKWEEARREAGPPIPPST